MSKWKKTTDQAPDLSGTQIGDLIASLSKVKDQLEARISQDNAGIQSILMEKERLIKQRQSRVRQKENTND
jgi:hypothetical protein